MIYKVGSRGEVVKKIQKALGADVDGIFGKGTEAAVKQWQAKNGLAADGLVSLNTLAKMGINANDYFYDKAKIEAAIKSKGYQWFDDKDLHLNIVGVRNSDTGTKVTNAFDDKITVSYKKDGNWIYKEWMNTTDPGTRGVMQYHNAAGVARLVPGQYIDSYFLGLHQGKYEALRQQKPVKVYRDKNKDMNYDEEVIQEGIFGINIHKAGADSTYVENWSEGCQVFKRAAEFEEFMNIVRQSNKAGFKSFTYTLIESKDI